MNNHTSEARTCQNTASIVVGASIGTDSMDHHYGRRVEQDGSWSIYHVFTGVLAVAEGRSLTGMSRSCATQGMLAMNHRSESRRRDRGCRSRRRPAFGYRPEVIAGVSPPDGTKSGKFICASGLFRTPFVSTF